ncbi:hypothetical protein FW774_17870 [Pedobacter sp. BS3]|uniref:hypothetical protein n=1 Tax=Pedobacter sp. BS3 TaxID=2567937 RepID=UPI0011F01DDF|nr:hypothetical protein [Pedobacter sp. BS3]TZF81432.1 hypothetical protein FW774_17870 [Pedobacter sp. BS3]
MNGFILFTSLLSLACGEERNQPDHFYKMNPVKTAIAFNEKVKVIDEIPAKIDLIPNRDTVLQSDKIKLTNLGPQVKDAVIQGSIFAKDDSGKKLVYTVVRGVPAHLLGFDTNDYKLVVDLPVNKTDGSWDLTVSSDGWLYLAGGYGGYLYKHKPGSDKIENVGRALGTESYLWDLTPGKNGEIFGASYPSCRVFRYHPKDGFSDVGKGPLVQGENYVRSLVYHKASDKIYAGIGSHAHLIELDVKTGIKRDILPEEYKRNEFVYNMGLVNNLKGGDCIFFTVENVKKSLIYNLSTRNFTSMPDNMYVKTVTKAPQKQQIYYSGGAKLYSYNLSDATGQPREIMPIGSNALAATWDSENVLVLLNTYGNLIKFDPKTGQKTMVRLNIPAQPIGINVTATGPDGRIWTGGYLAGSNAAYDPATGKTEVYRGLAQSESINRLGKNLYFGIYPHGRFYVYNTEKPWDIEKGNPYKIGQVQGQDRPFAALGIPDLNKVFWGTVPNYGKNGGVLVEYDIKSKQLNSYKDIVAGQSVITLVYANKLVIGGTSVWGGLGILPEALEAKLFIWNPLTNTKETELIPVPGAKAITCLINGPDGNIWGIAAGTLFVFDPVELKVISLHKICHDTRNGVLWRPDALLVHPNGKLYGSIGGQIFSLDPVSMKPTMLNITGTSLALGNNGAIYFQRSLDLWKIEP